MSWSLGYQHGFGAQPAERFGCGEDQQWMSIDCVARNVIDQIGLEDYRLALDVDREEAKARGEDLVKLLRVLLRIEDRDSGSLRSLIRMIFGEEEWSGRRRASSQSRAANKKVSTGDDHCPTPNSPWCK